MSRLAAFLENFDKNNKIGIYDVNDELLFEGETGDVPGKITDMMSVIRGTAKWTGEYLTVKVKKS